MNIQKILPACAVAMGVVLALATSAFKQAPKDKSGDDMYTFVYNGPDYSQSQVQADSNWVYTADPSRCSDDDVKACKIYVPEEYVNDPGGANQLKSTFTITATSGTVSHVTLTDAGSGDDYISNKSAL